MIEKIRRNKATFVLSCCFILIAVLSAKEFLLTGCIVYRRWASPEGSGLIMRGWQALGVVFGEAAIGLYGLYLVVRKPKDTV